jgi:hypothetical protein
VANFSAGRINSQIRAAQRQVEQQIKREVARVNRENQRIVADANRKLQREIDRVNRANQQEAERVNRANQRTVDNYNRQADAHNKKVIDGINQQLRQGTTTTVRYTQPEERLAHRVHEAVALLDPREYDTFLSYARLDGETVATELRNELDVRGVAVWFDQIAIKPGHSQSLQMDQGLRKARSGIALLTPSYLTGRFWTERELGALLSKSTLIPVLHGVTFDDVKEYSGILPDLAGFSTATDTVAEIAEKIAAAVLVTS